MLWIGRQCHLDMHCKNKVVIITTFVVKVTAHQLHYYVVTERSSDSHYWLSERHYISSDGHRSSASLLCSDRDSHYWLSERHCTRGAKVPSCTDQSNSLFTKRILPGNHVQQAILNKNYWVNNGTSWAQDNLYSLSAVVADGLDTNASLCLRWTWDLGLWTVVDSTVNG